MDRNEQITSKDVFPKRSAKMIDGTEKSRIPLTFATESRKQSFEFPAHVMLLILTVSFIYSTALAS